MSYRSLLSIWPVIPHGPPGRRELLACFHLIVFLQQILRTWHGDLIMKRPKVETGKGGRAPLASWSKVTMPTRRSHLKISQLIEKVNFLATLTTKSSFSI